MLGATLAGEFGWWTARRPFYVDDEIFSPFGLLAASVFMLAAYAAWAGLRMRHNPAPLFRGDLFRNRRFSVGAGLGFCFQLAVGGLLVVLAVFLQSALYLDALDTGLVLLPYTLGIFVFALGASRLPAVISAISVIRVGLVLMFSQVVDRYFAFHGESSAVAEAEHARA